jgi:hypothetical protein
MTQGVPTILSIGFVVGVKTLCIVELCVLVVLCCG